MTSNPPASGVAVGDVLYISDTVTRFSTKSIKRWSFVSAITGFNVRVVPRSTTVRGGVFTPAGTMAEFTKDGWFRPTSLRVGLADAQVCRNIGQLPEETILAATIRDKQSGFCGYGCSLVIPFMGTHWNRRAPESGLVHVASSAGTVIARDLYRRVGGYDEKMIIYGGIEPEFSVRAWLFGAQISACPALEITHRFRRPAEVAQMVRTWRWAMVHNALRFGILYLEEAMAFTMIRHYAQTFPDAVARAFNALEMSDVWERRDWLRRHCRRSFSSLCRELALVDQAGRALAL